MLQKNKRLRRLIERNYSQRATKTSIKGWANQAFALIMIYAVLLMAVPAKSLAADNRQNAFNNKNEQATPVQPETTETSKISAVTQEKPPRDDFAAEPDGQTATELENGDVLIVGGSSAKIYFAASDSFGATGTPAAPRENHAAVRLSDGRVLITGGETNGEAIASSEIFDPASGKFSPAGQMNTVRAHHTATLLADGRVLIAGGSTAEIYDAASDNFTTVGTMTAVRNGHSAVLLKDGRVLIVGGADTNGTVLSTAELFNPSTREFIIIETTTAQPRRSPILNVLPDGKVQIIGGASEPSMEVFDAAAGKFGAFVRLPKDGNGHPEFFGQMMNTPTRAAVIDKTVVELRGAGKALAFAGGDEKSSQAELFQSSNARITTRALNYSAGENIEVSGAGFTPNETVELVFYQFPGTSLNPPSFKTQATADGAFTFEGFTPEVSTGGSILVAAKGEISKADAQTPVSNLSPGTLGNYSTAGLAGTETSIGSTGVAANVGFSLLTRSSPSNPSSTLVPASAGNSFSSSGWTNSFNTNNYYEFTISPTACYQFSASQMSVGLQRSNTGPTSVVIRSSLDNYNNNIATISVPFNTPQAPDRFIIPLSAVAGLQNSSVAVTLRIYGFGATSTGGTLRITGVASPNATVGVEVDGTVVSQQATVTGHPSNQTVSYGNNASFFSTATTPSPLPAPSQQWQVSTNGGMTWTDMPGENANALNLALPTVSQSGYQYRSKFSNACGDVFSNAATLTVNAASATVALNNLSHTYDGTPKSATATTTPNGLGVTFSYVGTGMTSYGPTPTPPTNAGTYNVTGTINDPNYTGSDTQPFVISQASPTVTWNNPADIVYGTALSGTQLNAIASVPGTFAYTPASGTVLNAGNGQTLSVIFTPTDTVNYTTQNATVQINVLQAPLNITASSHTVTYGGAVPTISPNYTGFVNGDTAASLTTQPICITAYTQGSPVSGSPYSSSCSGAANANYAITYTPGTVTVNQATLTITASSHTVTYGAAAPTITPGYTGLVNGDLAPSTAPTCSTTYMQGASVAGSPYPSSCAGAADPNYSITYTNGAVTVNQAALTITASSHGVNYGGAVPTITPSYTGLVNGDTAPSTLPTCSTTYVQGSSVSGSPYPTNCTGAADPNYSINYVAGTVTVSVVALTITASSHAVNYGDIVPTITPTYTGLVNGDLAPATAPICSTTYTQGSSVGSYPSSCMGAADPNYTISYVNGAVTVSAVALTIMASSHSINYGDAAPTITPSYTGFVNGDTAASLTTQPTCSTTYTQGSAVGSYPSTCMGATSSNYTISYVAGSVSVNQAALIITASSHGVNYGGVAPTITPIYSGLVNGDLAPATAPTCSTTYTQGSSAGSYPSSCSGAIDPNYSISYANGSVVVNAVNLLITASSHTITYGAVAPTITPIYAGLVNGDTAPATLPSCSTTYTQGSPAGSYPSSCAGATDPNYTITYVSGTVTVNQAALTITASSHGVNYGDAVPTITPSYTGLVNGDLAPATLPTCSTTYTQGASVAGSPYPSSCTGASDPNYLISYVNGSVTVSAVALTITASSHTVNYGDATPTITPTYAGLVNGDLAPATLPTCSTTYTQGSPVGSYPSSCVGAADPNYTISHVSGIVTVSAVSLVITASSHSINYGDAAPTITTSYAGLVNGDTAPSTLPTCSTTYVQGSPVGSYPSSCTGAADPNYSITYVNGSVTVNAVNLLITASSHNVNYGDAAPTITPSYSGFVNGDTAASLTTQPTCSTTYLQGSPVGSYPSNCSGATSSNYTITYAPGAVTVNAVALTITASSHNVNYGAVAPTITPIYAGLVNGDTAPATLPTCSTNYTQGASVSGSPYPSSCVGASDPNYSITYTNGSVTVSAVALTITASSHNVNYGDVAPTITPIYAGLVNGDTAPATLPSCSTTYTQGSPVGSYPSSCVGAADPNYTITYVSGIVTVSAVSLVITASSHSINYGDAAPTITPSYLGFVNGDTAASLTTQPTCLTAYTQGSPVSGSPYSSSCSGATSGNYSISYVNGSVTVSAVALTITASSHNVNYGDVAPTITPIYTGLVNGDLAPATTPSCSTTYSQGSSVAGSPYPSSCTGAADPNYAITYVDGSVTVSAVALTITASSHIVTFNDPAPTITPSYLGLVNGDLAPATAPTCLTSYTQGSLVSGSPYSSTCAGAVDSNYTISYVAGTVTVNQASQTITFGMLAPQTYGNAPFTLNATASSGLTVTFMASGNCTVSGNTVTLTAAGSCTITASQAGDSNYAAATPVMQSFTIAPNTNPIIVTMPPISNQLTGAMITVPVLVSSTNGHDIGAFNFTVTYNASVLSPVGSGFDTTGTMSSGFSVGSTPGSGALTIDGFGSPDLVGGGTLINLKFNVIGSNPDCTDLNFSSFTFNEGGPTATASYTNPLTSVCVVNGTIDGNVSYGNVLGVYNQPSSIPVSGVSMSVTGATVFSATTNSSGDYLLSGFGNGAHTVTPAKTGGFTVGAGGHISSNDSSRIQQYVLNPTGPTTMLTAPQLLAADVSGNGSVTSFDAAMIQRYILNNPNTGATGNWVFVDPFKNYPSVAANQTAQNYSAYLMGDVTGNWTAPVGPLAETDAKEQKTKNEVKETAELNVAPVTVQIPTTSVPSGVNFDLPIFVGELTGENVTSYDFDVIYDPTVLQPQSTAVSTVGTISSGASVGANIIAPGRLRVSGFSGNTLLGSGTLVILKLTAIGANGTSSALTFAPFVFNEGIPTSTVTNGSVSISVVTSANASVGGKLVDANGNAVARATVVLTGTNGNSRSVVSNNFGKFSFADVVVGETYVISVKSKGYSFAPQTVSVSADITDLILTAGQ